MSKIVKFPPSKGAKIVAHPANLNQSADVLESVREVQTSVMISVDFLIKLHGAENVVTFLRLELDRVVRMAQKNGA